MPKGVIFNINGGEDIGLEDNINHQCWNYFFKGGIRINIIGAVIDPSLGDKVIVTVIATGVDKGSDIITDKIGFIMNCNESIATWYLWWW